MTTPIRRAAWRAARRRLGPQGAGDDPGSLEGARPARHRFGGVGGRGRNRAWWIDVERFLLDPQDEQRHRLGERHAGDMEARVLEDRHDDQGECHDEVTDVVSTPVQQPDRAHSPHGHHVEQQQQDARNGERDLGPAGRVEADGDQRDREDVFSDLVAEKGDAPV